MILVGKIPTIEAHLTDLIKMQTIQKEKNNLVDAKLAI
jgi:hypothetical protein